VHSLTDAAGELGPLTRSAPLSSATPLTRYCAVVGGEIKTFEVDGSDCSAISARAGFTPGTFLVPPPPGVSGGAHKQHCTADGAATEVDCKTVKDNYGASFTEGYHTVQPFGAAKRAVTLFCPAAGDDVIFKDCGEAAEADDVKKWPKIFQLRTELEGKTVERRCIIQNGKPTSAAFT